MPSNIRLDHIELSRLQSPLLLEELKKMPPPKTNKRLEKIATQLEDLCSETISGQSWTSPLVKD